jgi:cytosylglucuronate decarboxylase
MADINTSPKILIVRVLEACNAGCFMCDFAFSEDTYRFSLDEARKVAELVAGSNIKVVRLTGGEPLLLPNLEEFLVTFKKVNVLNSIITNGFYLPSKAHSLAKGLLDHIIISIDGENAKKHDKYRRLPGLYANICKGISVLRDLNPSIIIRANTVVGKHNLSDLKQIYENLTKMGVTQWSIIPLKRGDHTWGNMSLEYLIEKFDDFKLHVTRNPGPLKLLGYSLDWAGRNQAEILRTWHEKRAITPKGRCLLVDQVRYFTPKDGLVFPCNCVPHRTRTVELGSTWMPSSVQENGLKESRDWLRTFGPFHCMGCEPINAALGEGLIDLNAEPLGF